MKKRREQPNREFEQTLFTLLIAFLGGGGVSIYFGSAFSDLQSIGDQNTRKLPGWQVNMGSICIGLMAFIVILFCMEVLRKRSKVAGWRSSWPWMPLVGLTVLATFVHIPVYFVILAGAIYITWACHRMFGESSRSAPRSK
jgi:hypothetical protein